jgi:uncharacterized protein YbjT (DUF2867 family)
MDRSRAGGHSLIVGASGAIGARLADRLLETGAPLRLAGRRPEVLRARWPAVEAVALDVLRPESISPALADVDTAYYLVHSMGAGEAGFEDRDRRGARAFAEGAAAAGVRTIVYLGGLGAPADDLSHHLASRHETGRMLASGATPVLEFRAGMVIAGDSASFVMLNDLVKRLPVMVTPEWVRTRSQPIGVDDVLTYLVAGHDADVADHHAVVEVGGADVLSYRNMMVRVAEIRGRPLSIVTVPVLTPRLSSLWCGLVTSVPTSIARPLVDGLVNETIVRDDAAARLFPGIRPLGFDAAVRAALTETTTSPAWGRSSAGAASRSPRAADPSRRPGPDGSGGP